MKPGKDYVGIVTPFYCHDGKGNILMQKRGEKARDEVGRWDPGGGKLEKGLTLEENVRKEVREEYNCECEIQDRLPTHEIIAERDGEKVHWLVQGFFVKVNRDEAENGEPEKFNEVKWFSLDELPENLHSGFAETLERYREKFEHVIGSDSAEIDLEGLSDFFENINDIKHKERQGWKNAGIEGVTDTIASHSFGAALLAWIMTQNTGYDTDKAVKTMLIHDLIMAHLRDLTPEDEDFDIKKQIEDEREDQLMMDIPEPIEDEFKELYREYRAQETDFARFCREIDKIETLMQAKKYSKILQKDILEDFLDYYSDQFESERGTELFRQLDETDLFN